MYNVKFLKGTAAGYTALTKDANTFYYTDDANLYLGEIKLSNATDLANAVSRVAANEGEISTIKEQLSALVGGEYGSISDMITTACEAVKTELDGKIATNTAAIATLNGTGDGSVAKAVADAKALVDADVEAVEGRLDTAEATITKLDGADTVDGSVKAQIKAAKEELVASIEANKTSVDGVVKTLVGKDTNKSVRTIANEELAAQLIPEGAKDSLDTLAEIAKWIQDHPDDAAAMNKSIADLTDLVGTLPEDAGADTVVAYVAKLVEAEETRATGVEDGFETRIAAVEGKFTGEGSVDGKIAAAQAAAEKAAKDYADGLAVNYDAAGAAATAETNAKDYADGLAGNYDVKGSAAAAETNAKAYVDTALTWRTF